MTNSFPSSVKPPRPLKYLSSMKGSGAEGSSGNCRPGESSCGFTGTGVVAAICWRSVPRDATSTIRAAAKARRWRSELSLRKEDVGCKLPESLNISRPNVEPAHFKLRMCPRCLERARACVKLRIAFGQSDDGFAQFCDHSHKRKL